MPQRHSKNNNDLAFFTYDEKRKLGYGTQKERLGKDSIKPFDACCLCLKPFIDPMCCQKGHVFCKECILECLLAQKKDIQRKLAAHAALQKQEKEEEEENDRNHGRDKHGFHGANSVKATSYEEEALRTMKAFWLPSATPEAPAKVEAPSTSTVCPEGKGETQNENPLPHPIYRRQQRRMNPIHLIRHIFVPAARFVWSAIRHVKRNLVNLEKGGTGFAGHGDRLQATDFKHLGSGSGLGLVRPAMKT
ncbi:hypothetical protein Pint_10793 [Pistacia integerrima]|uniref:Uncharacterized protein n=1 Tax=Pistacia integerrima TaxID=434235 RepID=A0ACC0XIM1_9ROSI|nr:hypothetical protein Pint_10793 [Pistacia integerrima]